MNAVTDPQIDETGWYCHAMWHSVKFPTQMTDNPNAMTGPSLTKAGSLHARRTSAMLVHLAGEQEPLA